MAGRIGTNVFIEPVLLEFLPFYRKMWEDNEREFSEFVSDEQFLAAYMRSLEAAGDAKLSAGPDGRSEWVATEQYMKNREHAEREADRLLPPNTEHSMVIYVDLAIDLSDVGLLHCRDCRPI